MGPTGILTCVSAPWLAVPAGAINATYFLSEQRQGLNVYSEDLTGGFVRGSGP